MAKDAFYLKHDLNARADEKIVDLLRAHSWTGYGLYWAIVEKLYEGGGRIAARFDLLAYDLRAEASQIESIVSSFGLFFIEDGKLGCRSVDRRLAERFDMREKRAAAGAIGGSVRVQRMREARLLGKHTTDEWDEMLAVFAGTCARCRGKFETLTLDHIVPIYQGGSDSIANIQPLCSKCNSSKGPESIDHRPGTISALGKQMLSKWLEKSSRRGEEKRGEEREITTAGASPSAVDKSIREASDKAQERLLDAKLEDARLPFDFGPFKKGVRLQDLSDDVCREIGRMPRLGGEFGELLKRRIAQKASERFQDAREKRRGPVWPT